MEASLKKEHIVTSARNLLRTSNFETEGYTVKPVSDTPVGFMARHLLVTLTVRFSSGKETLNFFVKALPSSEKHRSMIEDMWLFQKEIVFYEVLESAMAKVLPPEYPLPVPKCYLTLGNRMDARGVSKPPSPGSEELVVLEDVTKRGYGTCDKMTPLDLAHCLVAVRTMARFHAASFLLVPGARDLFLPATEMLLSKKPEHGYNWAMASAETTATAVVGFWPERFGGPPEYREEVLRRLRDSWKALFRAVTPSDKYFNVLCHGDVWVNNFMFRYEGGVAPADALLVDLQLIRFVPAAFDLLLFLHTATTRDFRERHAGELLAAYHDHLGDVAGRAAVDRLMSREALRESMEELAFFGKVICTAYLPIILNDEEVDPFMGEGSGEPPDFSNLGMINRGEKVVASAKVNQLYRIRIKEAYREVLEHLGLWK